MIWAGRFTEFYQKQDLIFNMVVKVVTQAMDMADVISIQNNLAGAKVIAQKNCFLKFTEFSTYSQSFVHFCPVQGRRGVKKAFEFPIKITFIFKAGNMRNFVY